MTITCLLSCGGIPKQRPASISANESCHWLAEPGVVATSRRALYGKSANASCCPSITPPRQLNCIRTEPRLGIPSVKLAHPRYTPSVTPTGGCGGSPLQFFPAPCEAIAFSWSNSVALTSNDEPYFIRTPLSAPWIQEQCASRKNLRGA